MTWRTHAVAAALALCVMAPAWAVDTDGRMAVGFNAAMVGASARFFGSGDLGVEVTVAGGSQFWNASNELFLDAYMAGEVRMLWVAQRYPDANLLLFLGVIAAIDDIDNDDSFAATLDVDIAAGVSPELFLSEHLSIETDLAVAVSITDVGQPAYSLSIAAAGSPVSLVGGLTFHWYLR